MQLNWNVWIGTWSRSYNKVNLTNTVVCITGDHGEMLGDHNMGGQKVPYQPSISVPLLCMGAGVVPHYVHTDPVTTLDLVECLQIQP